MARHSMGLELSILYTSIDYSGGSWFQGLIPPPTTTPTQPRPPGVPMAPMEPEDLEAAR